MLTKPHFTYIGRESKTLLSQRKGVILGWNSNFISPTSRDGNMRIDQVQSVHERIEEFQLEYYLSSLPH